MNILALIKEDHEAASALLRRICDRAEKGDRSALFEKFRAEVGAHNDAESKTFYARLAETEEGRTMALEGDVEHQLVARLLAEMQRSRSKGSEQWMAKAQVLKELLEHHIEEEEDQAFAAARKLFDDGQLEEMGAQMARLKARRLEHAA